MTTIKNFFSILLIIQIFSAVVIGGAESSGGEPMQAHIPTEPFEYVCKVTYIADVPESYAKTNLSETTVIFNNKRTSVNLIDLNWMHFKTDYLEVGGMKIPTSEQPLYSFAGSILSIRFGFTKESTSPENAVLITELSAIVSTPSKEAGNYESAEGEVFAAGIKISEKLNVAAKLKRSHLSNTNYLFKAVFAECEKTR